MSPGMSLDETSKFVVLGDCQQVCQAAFLHCHANSRLIGSVPKASH